MSFSKGQLLSLQLSNNCLNNISRAKGNNSVLNSQTTDHTKCLLAKGKNSVFNSQTTV